MRTEENDGDPKEWPETITYYEPGDSVVVVLTKAEIDHGGPGHEIVVSAVVEQTIIKNTRSITDEGFHSTWVDPLYVLRITGGDLKINNKKAKFYHSATYKDELDFIKKVMGENALEHLNTLSNRET